MRRAVILSSEEGGSDGVCSLFSICRPAVPVTPLSPGQWRGGGHFCGSSLYRGGGAGATNSHPSSATATAAAAAAMLGGRAVGWQLPIPRTATTRQ